MNLKYLMNLLINIIYPKKCVVCNDILDISNINNYICKKCEYNMPFISGNVCDKCGSPIDNNVCEICTNNIFAFDYGFSVFKYETVKKSIFRFKYKCVKDDGYGIAEIMCDYIIKYHNECIKNIDLIVPVPIHSKRLSERGFNQSDILGKCIAKKFNISYSDNVIIRVKETLAQNKLSNEKRKHNIKGAFEITDVSLIENKRIMIIDDIFTTGSTINECARLMISNGAYSVIFYTYSTT